MFADSWFAERGSLVAEAINLHGDLICEHVSSRLASRFPGMCYDPLRPDAVAFQQKAFDETPRRFHRLLQGTLLCASVAIIEREYAWGCKILIRYQVERHHMLAHVRWYFEEVFALAQLTTDDKEHLIEIRDYVGRVIESLMPAAPSIGETEYQVPSTHGRNSKLPRSN